MKILTVVVLIGMMINGGSILAEQTQIEQTQAQRKTTPAKSSSDVSSIIENLADQLVMNHKIHVWESSNRCDGRMNYEEDPQIQIEYNCKGITGAVWAAGFKELFYSLIKNHDEKEIQRFIIWLAKDYLEKNTFTAQEWKSYREQDFHSSGIPIGSRGLFVENVLISASRSGEGKIIADLKRLIILYSQAQSLKPTAAGLFWQKVLQYDMKLPAGMKKTVQAGEGGATATFEFKNVSLTQSAKDEVILKISLPADVSSQLKTLGRKQNVKMNSQSELDFTNWLAREAKTGGLEVLATLSFLSEQGDATTIRQLVQEYLQSVK